MDIVYWAIDWLTTKGDPGNWVIVYMQECFLIFPGVSI